MLASSQAKAEGKRYASGRGWRRLAVKEEGESMTNTILLIIFVASSILFIIGFGLRDRNFGLALLGVSLLGVLFAVLYKAYTTFG